MSENTRYVDREGTFLCTVERPSAGWFGETEKGSEFIRLPLRVKAQADGERDQVGRTITHSAWLTAKAFDKTIETLLKVFPNWSGDLSRLAANDGDFDGLNCEIVAEPEEYEGKTRIKVKWLNAVGGGGKPMAREKVEGLVARLNRRALELANALPKPAGQATPAVKTPSTSPEFEDDDIPF